MKQIYIVLSILGVLFFLVFIFATLSFVSSISISPSSGTKTVALVSLQGIIVTDGSAGIFDTTSYISSTQVQQQLQAIRNNPSIAGVIFEINSPGGSGVASEEIMQAIQSLQVPTVAYIRDVGASGGYWIASASDTVFASQFSIVGSIGVIGSYLEFSELLERYNVTYQRFVAGDSKDMGSPFYRPTQEQAQAYQDLLDELHTFFIEDVARNRGMSIEAVRRVADGSVYSGARALELGLIDGIGNRRDAIAHMEEVLGSSIRIQEMRRQPSLFGGLLSTDFSTYYSFLSLFSGIRI